VFVGMLVAASGVGGVRAERTVPIESDDRSGSVAPDAPSSKPPAIIMGFVGGFIRHDNPVHSEVQLAARLRQEYPSGVDIETFESYRGQAARNRILSLLDTDQDGKLTPAEKQGARVILYGHSWGGSEAVQVARELDKDGVPVLLTIQVDSVSHFFQNDQIIPPNVAAAANFYQPDGFVHGEPAIRAQDPARTTIIGNFKFVYKSKPYTCTQYPWYDHYIVKPHTQIECDPSVWQKAEDLIREALSR
jgi:hypothetical protein